MGKRFAGLGDLFLDQGRDQQLLVDVQEDEVGHALVEPFKHSSDLLPGAQVMKPSSSSSRSSVDAV